MALSELVGTDWLDLVDAAALVAFRLVFERIAYTHRSFSVGKARGLVRATPLPRLREPAWANRLRALFALAVCASFVHWQQPAPLQAVVLAARALSANGIRAERFPAEVGLFSFVLAAAWLVLAGLKYAYHPDTVRSFASRQQQQQLQGNPWRGAVSPAAAASPAEARQEELLQQQQQQEEDAEEEPAAEDTKPLTEEELAQRERSAQAAEANRRRQLADSEQQREQLRQRKLAEKDKRDAQRALEQRRKDDAILEQRMKSLRRMKEMEASDRSPSFTRFTQFFSSTSENVRATQNKNIKQ